jgi:hypothetical protein
MYRLAPQQLASQRPEYRIAVVKLSQIVRLDLLEKDFDFEIRP